MMKVNLKLIDKSSPWVNIEVSARSKRRKFKRYDIGYSLEEHRFARSQYVLDLEDYNPGALEMVKELVEEHRHALTKVVIRHVADEVEGWE